MMLETPQLMLSFEPEDARSATVSLRIRRSEREYFRGQNGEERYTSITLPRAFQETAFMDEGGWRKHPRAAVTAADLGYRMWGRLPESLTAELLTGAPDRPLRLAIVSRSSGVDDIPWEWLNDGSPDGVVAANERLRFIRLVPCLYSSPPLTVSGPIRVLTVTTNPKDERFLILPEERRTLWSELESNAAYEVRHLDEPRIEAFQQAIATAPPHIVHYVGHAGITAQSGALILHDNHGGTRWVTASELSRLLPSSARLLCLSTPVTAPNYQTGGLVRIAHSPSELPLPTTIANQYALEPEAAHTFWKRFYAELPRLGGDVVEAFHLARRSVFVAKTDTWSWASFTLVVRDGTGHPLRMAASDARAKERYGAELQAQWSARLANTLANRAQTLGPEARKFVASAIEDEEARIDQLRNKIEKL